MTYALELVGLSKEFRLSRRQNLHALSNVNLQVKEGEIVGLVGESGCGKSTLGKTIVGLHPQSAGEIRLFGELLEARRDRHQRRRWSQQVQMIFQDPYSCLNPRMTVGDIIAEGPDAHKLWSKDQRQQKISFWLQKVGLDPSHASRYPHEFSGGQRQRIGIARALAMQPRVVVCDEPISALDVSVQAQIVSLLKTLQQEQGLTYLFIAHDLSMVRVICDRMAVMYLGHLVEWGPSADIYQSPQHPYTQALIAANPLPDPKAEAQRPRQQIQGEISSPVNLKPGCLFAPRCPHATELCRSKTPQAVALDGGKRFVACHLFSH